MCVCVCVYLCLSIYVCLCVFTSIYDVYIYVYVCMYVCAFTHMKYMFMGVCPYVSISKSGIGFKAGARTPRPRLWGLFFEAGVGRQPSAASVGQVWNLRSNTRRHGLGVFRRQPQKQPMEILRVPAVAWKCHFSYFPALSPLANRRETFVAFRIVFPFSTQSGEVKPHVAL